jgi:hypothetical protein
MNILKLLKSGWIKVSSILLQKSDLRNVCVPPSTNTNGRNREKIPDAVMKYYQIRMLGKPFSEMDTKGRVFHGYEFEGKKYYDGNPKL